MESFKSMRKKFINKRSAIVESSLHADENNNDIIENFFTFNNLIIIVGL